jgi:hypothetical protein
MTTTAGHSFYIGPIVFFYNQVNDTGSWEPPVLFVFVLTKTVNYLKKSLIQNTWIFMKKKFIII